MGDAEERTQLEHHFLDCAKSFNWAAVKALLEETPDLLNVQPCGRWSALHQAAYEGNELMVADLLERGADPAARTRDGKTPLDVASGRVETALRDHIAAQAAAAGPEIRVTAVLELSGEPLGGPVKCRGTDSVAAFGRALAKQDPAGRNNSYTVLVAGKKLDRAETLAQAGIEDGATVGVVREKGTAVEVETLEDVWEHHPGTRYPVTLSRNLKGVRFYATPACREEDQVEFSNIDFGGGFKRSFVNREGQPNDYTNMNFIEVYVQSSQTFEVVAILADEARFGGIVITPLDAPA